MAHSVKKRTTEMVYPASPSPGGVLELNVLDMVQPRVLMNLLFFFRASADQQDVLLRQRMQEPPAAATAVSRLKQSLAEALAIFYPFAGRLRERRDGDLEVLCNDEGASFHEVWVDCKLADVLPQPSQPLPDSLGSLLLPLAVHENPTISDIPTFLAQVTHFECGSMCLGILSHHSICDGSATSQFLNSWAVLARSRRNGEAAGAAELEILRPHMDRAILISENQQAYPPLMAVPEEAQGEQAEVYDLPTAAAPVVRKVFSFTPDAIEALREKAGTDDQNRKRTRFEVLAAHMWKGCTQARGVEAEGDVRLSIAVDGRERMVAPPVAAGYFGNLVVNSQGQSTRAGHVLQRPLGEVAGFVKETVGKVTDSFIRSALRSPASSLSYTYRPTTDLHISSLERLPLYHLDFGWGTPFLVRLLRSPPGVLFFLPSPLGSGHVDAVLPLHAQHMPRFEEYYLLNLP